MLPQSEAERFNALEKKVETMSDCLSEILKELRISSKNPKPNVVVEKTFYFNKTNIFKDPTKVETISFTVYDAGVNFKNEEDIMKEQGLKTREEFKEFVDQHSVYIFTMKYDGKTYTTAPMGKKDYVFFKNSFEHWVGRKVF